MRDFKSLCAAVTICIQTNTSTLHIHKQTAFWPAYTKSSASWATKQPAASSITAENEEKRSLSTAMRTSKWHHWPIVSSTKRYSRPCMLVRRGAYALIRPPRRSRWRTYVIPRFFL